MKARHLLLLGMILSIVVLLCACADSSAGMRDGYYTAEMASFDAHGWKEYLTIYVSGDRIVTAEYNARNESGFIKSWDMNYMRTMNASDGTYPNEYTRAYMVALLNWQDPLSVDAISGATHSHETFQLLAAAAIEKAMAGDRRVALVEPSEAEVAEAEN